MIVSALLAIATVSCSKKSPPRIRNVPTPKLVELGVLQFSNNTPNRYDLGQGNSATLTLKKLSAGKAQFKIVLEGPDASGKKVTVNYPPLVREFGRPASIFTSGTDTFASEIGLRFTPILNDH
mgnify:FL=1